jgi:hypothetical protein
MKRCTDSSLVDATDSVITVSFNFSCSFIVEYFGLGWKDDGLILLSMGEDKPDL